LAADSEHDPLQNSTSAFYEALGKRIQEARRSTGATQSELAAAANLTRASLANIESGRQQLLVHHLVAIAAATDTTIEALVPSSSTPAVNIEQLARDLPREQGDFVARVLQGAAATHQPRRNDGKSRRPGGPAPR
jgi:transcriptional regulator with XRE-family HTH domain